jgi:hypothetical protein
MRIFHESGRGRAFLLAANCLIERIGILNLTSDDRERVRRALGAVVQVEVTPEIWQTVLRAGVACWEIEARDLGKRGLAGVAAVAGIPRSTFRAYFGRFLRPSAVLLASEPEPCGFPQYADERERNSMRLAALHHGSIDGRLAA